MHLVQINVLLRLYCVRYGNKLVLDDRVQICCCMYSSSYLIGFLEAKLRHHRILSLFRMVVRLLSS
jgi:hypothetical protein